MADPVQRGAAKATFPAPTSSKFVIAADTFRLTPTADIETEKDEAGTDALEVILNQGHNVSFTGQLKAGQTPVKIGDLLTLTYPTGDPREGAVEYMVTAAPEEGRGKVTKQNVELKRKDGVDYSP